jgi:hypothetical protein
MPTDTIALKQFTDPKLYADGLFVHRGWKYATDGNIMVAVETEEPGEGENWHQPIIALADEIRERMASLDWQPWPVLPLPGECRVGGVKLAKEYYDLVATLPNVRYTQGEKDHLIYLAFDGGVGAVAGRKE